MSAGTSHLPGLGASLFLAPSFCFSLSTLPPSLLPVLALCHRLLSDACTFMYVCVCVCVCVCVYSGHSSPSGGVMITVPNENMSWNMAGPVCLIMHQKSPATGNATGNASGSRKVCYSSCGLHLWPSVYVCLRARECVCVCV